MLIRPMILRPPGLVLTPQQRVFASVARTGTGAARTQTTLLPGSPTVIITKLRDANQNAGKFDSTSGANLVVYPPSTNPAANLASSLTAFNADGSYGIGTAQVINSSGLNYIDWIFRIGIDFFSRAQTAVTNGTSKQIDASTILGNSTIGMVVVKALNASSPWYVWHRSVGNSQYLVLNTTAAPSASSPPISVSGSIITLAATLATATYEVLVFCHDTTASGIIQCGNLAVSGTATGTVNLGWTPQFLIAKTTSTAGNWDVRDASRGFVIGGGKISQVSLNLPNAEASSSAMQATATGFTYTPGSTVTIAYLAIKA